MTINKINYDWNGKLTKRQSTNKIIIHHMAGEGSPQDIHKIHLNNGWTGIGYHFFVRLNGEIYEGRPIDKVGAHTVGQNSCSIGVCFEGNFENRSNMPIEQLNAGIELIQYLKKKYPNAKISKHKDYQATACPGKNFPFNEISKGVDKPVIQELISINDIVWELNHRGIITDKELWLKKLEEDDNAYWLARKTANMTVNK